MMEDLYCPYCGDAKGDKISCCGESDFIPYEDLPEDFKDTEEDICPSCNGSGEGQYDGTRCSTCNGRGSS